ncbi:MAG: hypothetical protein O3A00_20945 [Planctomycetota bacterium]|nr:hypothetical protein [Planctomycetota bacterium]
MADCPPSQCGDCLPIPIPYIGSFTNGTPGSGDGGCGCDQQTGTAAETPPILTAGGGESCSGQAAAGVSLPFAAFNSLAAAIPSIFQMPTGNTCGNHLSGCG